MKNKNFKGIDIINLKIIGPFRIEFIKFLYVSFT